MAKKIDKNFGVSIQSALGWLIFLNLLNCVPPESQHLQILPKLAKKGMARTHFTFAFSFMQYNCGQGNEKKCGKLRKMRKICTNVSKMEKNMWKYSTAEMCTFLNIPHFPRNLPKGLWYHPPPSCPGLFWQLTTAQNIFVAVSSGSFTFARGRGTHAFAGHLILRACLRILMPENLSELKRANYYGRPIFRQQYPRVGEQQPGKKPCPWEAKKNPKKAGVFYILRKFFQKCHF